jgi:hypothetical protein
MIGTLLSVGGSLLGGILGNRARKKEAQAAREYDARRLQTLRADAEAAGFNPLTALKAGVGSAYQPTQANLSFGFMGDAFRALGQALDPMRRERARLENELLQTQIAAAQHEPGSSLDYYAPGGFVRARGGPGAAQISEAGLYPTEMEYDAAGNPAEVGDPDTGVVPDRMIGDDNARTERIFGVEMDPMAAQRNEDAGGEILGGMQTIGEWTGGVMDNAQANWLRLRGYRVFQDAYGDYHAYRPQPGTPEPAAPSIFTADQWVGDFNDGDPTSGFQWGVNPR